MARQQTVAFVALFPQNQALFVVRTQRNSYALVLHRKEGYFSIVKQGQTGPFRPVSATFVKKQPYLIMKHLKLGDFEAFRKWGDFRLHRKRGLSTGCGQIYAVRIKDVDHGLDV